jgi:hypothetical protein
MSLWLLVAKEIVLTAGIHWEEKRALGTIFEWLPIPELILRIIFAFNSSLDEGFQILLNLI